jgi:serine/threonine protein kinase
VVFKIGEIVGDYEVVGLLGRGGMGQVYKVRHKLLDRLDAMKVLLPAGQDDPQLHQRFEREIRVQASLQHPNIAALHTALWVEQRLLMIIEFVDGTTLEQKLRDGPVPVHAVTGYICRVLDALSYAHGRGVIHRDVKPGNIMIAADGTVKLTDFGIARTTHESLTRCGIAVGSLYYMSPEQIRTGAIDGRSDIYSVGVTLYEALVGTRPFRGDDDQAVITAHLSKMPTPPAEALPGLPQALSAIVMKSLAKDPTDRFQTADEFRLALESSRGVTDPSGARRSTAAPGIDAATLSRLEKCLAAAIGPIAKAVTARSAGGVGDVATLRRLLAENIPEEPSRQEFYRCCERNTAETTVRPSSAGIQFTNFAQTKPHTTREWTPEFLEKIQHELARYVGPLARVLVNKAAKKVNTPAQLIETLSGEIPNAKEREAFATYLHKALL